MIDGDMTVVAVASPTPGNAKKLADRFEIPRVYTDYRELAADADVEAVTVTSPNARALRDDSGLRPRRQANDLREAAVRHP